MIGRMGDQDDHVPSRRQVLFGMALGGMALGGGTLSGGSAAHGAQHHDRPDQSDRPPRPEPTLPRGNRPDVLYAVDVDGMGDADRVLAASLQGQLARRRQAPGRVAGIYLNQPRVGYGVWLAELGEVEGVDVREVGGPDVIRQLVERFAKPGAHGAALDRYVLYRTEPGDSDNPPGHDGGINVATTVAASTGAILLEESRVDLAEEYGLTLEFDARGHTDPWAFDAFADQISRQVAIEQQPSKAPNLRDYAILAGAYTFYDGNSDFRDRVVSSLDDDATMLGWGDASSGEHEFIGPSSRAGVHTVPSDWALNLSVLSGFGTRRLRQGGSGRVPDIDPDAHYVSFVMTDGDNVQWLLGDHQSDERWFGSPLRGAFPLGWGMAPSLVELAPTAMAWYYANQAANERFIVGPSGAGYCYPGMYPPAELERHTERLDALMSRGDMSVVQIIDFETFDRTDLWATYLRRRHIDGLIYLEYSRYDRHAGAVGWAENKPIVSPRTMLWEGLPGADEASVIAELNAQPADPFSTAGYSVVMVHVWSKDVGDVKTVVEGLAPHVRVVPPDVLIGLIGKHAAR